MSKPEKADKSLMIALADVAAGKLTIEHVADRFGAPGYDSRLAMHGVPPLSAICFGKSRQGDPLPKIHESPRVVYWCSPWQPGGDIEVLGLMYGRDGTVKAFRARILPPI
jgi:hypothetical protein